MKYNYTQLTREKGARKMNKEKRLELIRKQIEINKKNALEELQKEQMVPAMHSLTALVDLKAQELLLNEI